MEEKTTSSSTNLEELECCRKRSSWPLPPELLTEMHKCLPLADAIDILVNVPCQAIVLNNAIRIRNQLKKLKKILQKYTFELVDEGLNEYDEEEFEPMQEFEGKMAQIKYESLKMNTNVKWTPQLDALFRFGNGIVPTREFSFAYENYLTGMPEHFVQQLIHHLAYSRSTSRMLESVQQIIFKPKMPSFLAEFFADELDYSYSHRILFESMKLNIANDFTVHIHDGEYRDLWDRHTCRIYGSTVELHLVNNFDPQKWFNVCIQKYCNEDWILKITRMQPMHKLVEDAKAAENSILVEGNCLNVNNDKCIHWNLQWDAFLRRGTAFTPIRHFIAVKHEVFDVPKCYAEELIGYMANTKHPEDVLESFVLRFMKQYTSPVFHRLLEEFRNGIPEGGKLIEFGGENVRILWAKIIEEYAEELAELKNDKKLRKAVPFGIKFALENMPTNGQFVFEFDLEMICRREKIDWHIDENVEQIGMRKLQRELKIGQQQDEKLRKKRIGDGKYFGTKYGGLWERKRKLDDEKLTMTNE